ncbi:MAG: redoxin domain-containing protein [Melioribacteraceae bacterium]
MKKIFSSVVILIFFFSAILSYAQTNKNFSFRPEKPKVGETISITYNPAGSKLEKAENVSMIVHAYGKTIYYTDEIELKKSGNDWTGDFSAADTSAGVVLRFTDGTEYDNNGSKCFPIRFYGNDGKFVKYASVGLAGGYLNWFGAFQINPDAETAFKLFEEEFTLNPQLKKGFLTQYYSAFSKVDKDKAVEFLKIETENYEKTLTQSLEDLSFLLDIYTTQKLKDKAEKTRALILEKYPTSMQAEMLKFQEVYSMKDPAKKSELAGKFKDQFPNSQYITYLFPDPTQALIQAGKYEEAYDAIKKNPKAASGLYNALAWAMYEKDVNLPLAKEAAAKGIGLVDAEAQTSSAKRPPYYSESQWKKLMQSSGYAIIDTYGAILLKLGENAEALKYMTQAFEMDGGKSADVNERYAQALLSNGKTAEAMENLEKFISNGKGTAGMKEMLKQTYVKSKGSDSGFDNYLTTLESKAKKSAQEEMKKKMINEPAPKFTLVGLDGKKVSLKELKGKTVIIDFWATWCGPCKVSFPGMQKAVDKFANDPNVKFLFINTWENNVDDKKKNAEDFIKQNKYTFHVLLDNDNKVIESYKVNGIPTKFIIDKDGNIRFKSVGFDGNADGLVEELSTMIAMLK